MKDDRAPDEQDSQYVELAVEVFAMLADATRVRIVLALSDGERSVTELATLVDKSPTAVSQHLAKLRLARMVTTRHDGTRVFYRLVDEHARRLVTDAIHQAEHSVETLPRHHRAGPGASADADRRAGIARLV
ncbi:metalloregulator ArsR/SmtB family transcription factor [Rathayibacter sp. VKM Ac-2804]|uniref:ArsR/SmtB family transcription factor n=1 Tax=Rathayibacter sp. VKM Ac-2804 TaxID=2609257 RepID=UPI00132F1C8B|nr:metalloregulator ArsR/SmtB family transcription factor [Rathayibacter sp. VKM Ac-2804]QHF22832.1 metalloregulator ArsR/SmtB family transcription factor [Rathayibacter sp. VKM Ac-2804]